MKLFASLSLLFFQLKDMKVMATRPCKPISPAQNFDLDAFGGKTWYSIQQSPTFFQGEELLNCVTTTYTPLDEESVFYDLGWRFSILNSAEDPDGNELEFPGGCAKQNENEQGKFDTGMCNSTDTTATLTVLAFSEQYAVYTTAQPTKRTFGNFCEYAETPFGVADALYLFSSTPDFTAGTVNKLRAVATKNGIDKSILLPVKQGQECAYNEGD